MTLALLRLSGAAALPESCPHEGEKPRKKTPACQAPTVYRLLHFPLLATVAQPFASASAGRRART